MLAIDGSQGEGGGQVLRSALALSLVTAQPFRIERIRARRERPGLLRQHLTAVQAAVRVGRADVQGASLHSSELEFVPHAIVPGDYEFDVGTAGSATLVLQTLLPPLMVASAPSTLTLSGGTHNPWAPPFDFLQRAFLPVVERVGPRITATLERPGFYPAGGGRFSVRIEPARTWGPLDLLTRGTVRRTRARAVVAGLPRHIAERELRVVQKRLDWKPRCLEVEELPACFGPGNILMLEIESANITELFTAFGRRGIPAEQVAEQAADEVARYLRTDVPVGEHLADQLLIPMVLAGGGAFRALPLSDHARTNIDLIQRFVPREIRVEPSNEQTRLLTIS